MTTVGHDPGARPSRLLVDGARGKKGHDATRYSNGADGGLGGDGGDGGVARRHA